MKLIQTDNLSVVLGVRRIDEIRSKPVRELCYVNKGVNEKIIESTLRRFRH